MTDLLSTKSFAVAVLDDQQLYGLNVTCVYA